MGKVEDGGDFAIRGSIIQGFHCVTTMVKRRNPNFNAIETATYFTWAN